MIRQPAVADRFYPGNREALSRAVADLMPAPSTEPKIKALAAVAPHAGYIYSGAVAAETLSRIVIPESVILLGLNHHGVGEPVALSHTTWGMPMGNVPINEALADLLLTQQGPIVHDEIAHRFEHSAEVQVPFLQALQPKLSLVPIVLSHISYQLCEEVAASIVQAVRETSGEVLIVASSDMTHYESRASASRKDKMALNQVERLDARGLYDTVHSQKISMCGVIPVTVALIAATELGATRAEVVRYTDSGAVSGDTDQVVGYAGIIIS